MTTPELSPEAAAPANPENTRVTDKTLLGLMGVVTIALILDAVALSKNWIDDNEWHVWVFVGLIFANNANQVSWIRSRFGLHWYSLLAVPLVVVFSSTVMCAVGSDLFHAALPMFSIHALLCWLAASVFRIPDWYGDQVGAQGPRVFSLQALMALTLAQAVLFLVLKYGDFERIPPWGFVLLIGSAVTSWFLGSAMFSLLSRRSLLIMPATLIVLCTIVKLTLDHIDIGQSESDARLISFEFLIISFLLPAIIGFVVRFRRKQLLVSHQPDDPKTPSPAIE